MPRDLYDRALQAIEDDPPHIPALMAQLYPAPTTFPSQVYVVLSRPAFVTIQVANTTLSSNALFTPVILRSITDIVTVTPPGGRSATLTTAAQPI